MSKMDGLRAMREARYAEAAARAAQARSTATKAAPVAPVAPPKPKKSAPATSEPEPEQGLCGHRSMNGRTCTREHGHAAKSHRYG